MPRKMRGLAGALIATTVLTAGSISVSAVAQPVARHGHGSGDGFVKLVVNTQFESATSPVTKATGPFQGCTSVQDLYGEVVDLGHTLAFYGIKEVTCDRGDVIFSYSAILSTRREGVTRGNWDILVSTLPGVKSGGGKLFGDPTKCVDLTGDEGCVLDTFRGGVR